MIRKLACIALCALLSTTIACDKKETSKTDTTTKTNAATAKQKPEEPEEKLELTLAVAPAAKDGDVEAKAKKFAAALADETGYAVEVVIPESYADTIGKMQKDEINVAYFPAWAFLRAHLKADASLLVAEEIDGKLSFPSHWYVAKKSKLKDAKSLKGKKVAFGSPKSASGFLFPYAALVEAGVISKKVELKDSFEDLTVTSSDEEALKLLLEGKVDAAAASSRAFDALSEEERAGLRSVSEQGPVPTPVFAARAEIRLDDQEKLAAALVKLSSTPEYAALFGENRKLVKRSHGDHMTPLHEAQEQAETEYPVQ